MGMQKLDPSHISGGKNGEGTVENSLVVPQTLNVGLPSDPAI